MPCPYNDTIVLARKKDVPVTASVVPVYCIIKNMERSYHRV